MSMVATGLHTRRPAYDEIDLSSREFWTRPAAERETSFAILREHRPVSWQRPVESTLMPPDDAVPGYWAVVRHSDVVEVSRRSDTFVSGKGVMFEHIPEELLEASQSFLAMDSPRHTTIRRLVSAAFTPRQVARIEAQIAGQARRIVDDLLTLPGEADFVGTVAARLPMLTISEMIGIDPADHERVRYAANAVVALSDPKVLAGRDPREVAFTYTVELHQVALELAARRRAEPRSDLMTALVQAEVDGERLADTEISAFFVLLCVAGNDTTRQTTSHAMHALTGHPDQRAWLMADFDSRIGTAVEEFIRWATPVMTFVRTAAADVDLHGTTIGAGDKLAMFYPAANWDREVFADPERFDLSRQPNPHVGFGGGGVHFCLGSHLARTQLRSIFRELLHRVPDLEAHDPVLVPGNFLHAVAAMPCRFTVGE
jgi:cytochrome P450